MSQLLPCLNPLKRVNSILTRRIVLREESEETLLSQSPQTGQFNSYGWKIAKRTTDGTEVSIPSNGSIQFLLSTLRNIGKMELCLNPLKRVNSILTKMSKRLYLINDSLNPLKRVNSILTKSMSI